MVKKVSKSKNLKQVLAFIIILFLLVGLFFLSLNLGSIKVNIPQLFRGLFVDYDKQVQPFMI